MKSSWVMVLFLLLLAWPGESEVSSPVWSEEAFSLPKSQVSEFRESALLDWLLLSPLRRVRRAQTIIHIALQNECNIQASFSMYLKGFSDISAPDILQTTHF